MNKYYVRFNPGFVKNTKEAPWQIIETTNDNTVNKFLVNYVKIEVDTWTEKSMEDKHWWNIACNGFLTILDYGRATISSTPPTPVNDN